MVLGDVRPPPTTCRHSDSGQRHCEFAMLQGNSFLLGVSSSSSASSYEAKEKLEGERKKSKKKKYPKKREVQNMKKNRERERQGDRVKRELAEDL